MERFSELTNRLIIELRLNIKPEICISNSITGFNCFKIRHYVAIFDFTIAVLCLGLQIALFSYGYNCFFNCHMESRIVCNHSGVRSSHYARFLAIKPFITKPNA